MTNANPYVPGVAYATFTELAVDDEGVPPGKYQVLVVFPMELSVNVMG
jgi:hypothetical protein